MLIRSQDGKLLVPLGDHIIEIDNTMTRDGKFAIYACKSGTSWDIGTYINKEKAIKVLDMIQEAYTGCVAINSISAGLTANTVFSIDVGDNKEELTKMAEAIKRVNIFQMPQDSEVE